ncbi:MAG: hypothetical protein H0X66_20720 [Verrucomicrobia bacterium]|nr:hypothetical protein [Verrucomicrobiota bacterium]
MKLSLKPDEKLIELEATNLDETVRFRLPTDSKGPAGEVLVPYDELCKVVKGCTGKDVIRVVGDGKNTRIRFSLHGGFVDQTVEHVPLQEWPKAPCLNGEAINLPEEFKNTLKQAIECSSTDSSRYVLNGACLDVSSPTGHYVVGTDGHHLYAANSFAFKLDTSVVIPSQKFLLWPGFMDDGEWRLKAWAKEKNVPWMQIDSSRWTYISKQIDGNYPNWKQVVPLADGKWTKLTLDENAVEILLGVLPMLPGRDVRDQPVKLDVQQHGLAVQGIAKSGQSSDARIDGVRVDGKAVSTTLNRTFLIKALRFGFREISILDSMTPLLFTLGGKTMVVMPLRSGPVAPPAPATVRKTSPSETAPTEIPSPVEQQSNQTEQETKPMPAEPMTPPQRGNLKPQEPTVQPTETSAVDELLEHIEKTKGNLRTVFNDLNEMSSTLKRVSKEQKATDKEISKFRASLRSLQNVAI